MESFLFYIGKVALAAGAFYLLYLALFQHQKHFVFNRIYLPVSLAISFLIPLITFTSIKYIQPVSVSTANSFAYLPDAGVEAEPQLSFEWFHYLLGIYVFGIIVFVINLLIGHLKAINIIRFSRIKELFGAQVNLTKKDVHPFSFFKRIVLSENTLANPDLEIIVNHEMVHVKENHTLDILFAEILFLFQWFNPFAWLIKGAIRDNLEYLTDDQITKNNNAETYQLAMVGLAHKKGVAPFLTALNGSQLKNRIVMMKKKTENRYSLLKQLVVLPLLAILVMGLSNKEVKTEFIQAEKDVRIIVDGLELPADHPVVTNLDFSKDFDEGELIRALGIQNKVIANTLVLEDNPEDGGVYYLQTLDYKEGSNPEFDYLVSGYKLPDDKFKTISKVNDSNNVLGKIKDTYSNKPIQNASILIKELGIETKADKKGNYRLAFGKNEKALIVQVSAKGYHTNNVVYYGTDSELNVSLTPNENARETKQIIIKGEVTNENGEAIPGALVIIKGSQSGIICDSQGKYELGTEKKSTLIFSKEGYQSKEITIDKETDMRLGVELRLGDNVEPEEFNIKYTESEPYKVKGKVTNEKGEALTGVAVLIGGSQTGVITDLEGNYELDTQGESTLVFSMLGYVSKEIVSGGKSSINVQLKRSKEAKTGIDLNKIDYRDRNIDSFEKVSIPIQSNKDKSPLYVVDGKPVKGAMDIDPGNVESVNILKGKDAALYGIKGMTNGAVMVTSKQSINKMPGALVILDGKEFDGEVSDIDPENIEKIDVLKGGSASAMFGSKAKNGAIVIKSKNNDPFNGELPLLMVDGVKYEGDIKDINPKDIKSMEVLKDASSTAIHGSDAKNGVVLITTKEAAKVNLGKALVVKDGKVFDGDVSDIDPENIESVEVLKNESAIKLYGSKAKDGAIIIKSKNISLDGKAPMIIVDGLKYDGDINDIDPEDIASMDVLKDASAVAIYGADAKNGMVLISTKSVEITTEIELRKFIAQRIKYPLDLRNAHQEGVSKLYVELDENGRVSKVGNKKIEGATKVDEVVVVAYKPKDNVGTTVLNAQRKFDNEAKSVLYMLPKLKIDKFEGQTLEFTIKFMLQ